MLSDKIQLTRLIAEEGAPIAFYCSICKTTTFLRSPYLQKRLFDDFYLFAMCPEHPMHSDTPVLPSNFYFKEIIHGLR